MISIAKVKKTNTANLGKDIEQLVASYIAYTDNGNVKYTASLECCWNFSNKVKFILTL